MNPPESITPNLRAAAPETEALLSSASVGPGRVIRQARERARLGIEDLAAQTRLARSTLEALERDDFSQLNEAVYVRGYYRKCAKVLNLPEAELIAAYDKLYAPKNAPMPTKLLIGHSGSTMGTQPAGGGASSWALVIVIAAMLGAGAWFLTQDGGETVATPVALDDATSAIPAGAPLPATAFDSTPSATGPSLAVAGSLSDPAAATALAAPLAPTPGVELAPSTTLANANPEPSVPAADPLLAATPVSAVSPSDPGALVLAFKSASWVRIEDADGRLLLSGTVQSGDRQVLKGRTPYSLFIGYAPGVSVVFDGKPFDLVPHIRQNSTARINLPYVAAPPAAAP
jgi:cytoskeleton protein RodZ